MGRGGAWPRVPGADSGLGLSLLGLGPPSLHQGMAPAFPPSLGGSLPSAYQFVRDPQSGQLVVIPSDHLPHFGKWRLRASCWKGEQGGRRGEGAHPAEQMAGSLGLREDL